MNYKLIDIKVHGDERGKLASFEKDNNIPFDVKRAFYIFDSKGSVSRGCHANRNSEFLLVVISGSCKVRLDDGYEIHNITLNNPHRALYIDKMIWKEMYDFSYNSVLLVLTNTYYDEKEYIRNYNDFKEERGNV